MDVLQPVFDSAKTGAIAPALTDIERRLTKVAALRVKLTQVGQVVQPALFRTPSDVEVDTLNRLERASRVLTAF
ncbi:MAG: hypothetical protein L0H15_04820 [Nitrosospira sp.]|nr:hypothetical protein [Nitrosospira sp.]